MQKILVIGTGGTIASVKGEGSIYLDSPFKVLDYINSSCIEFECVSPFFVLSENIDFDKWAKLIEYIKNIDFSKYLGVIVLHGSDTLAYTGALLGNIFYNETIVMVASDKPVEDSTSNAVANFQRAVDFICSKEQGVYVSYNGLYKAVTTVSSNGNNDFYSDGKQLEFIENPVFTPKNILVIQPYVNINYNNYDLTAVDAVLHSMYHSATCPQTVIDFIDRCEKLNIPFYFVTSKSSADYESAKGFKNIIFNSTVENAYARLLLTK